MPAYPTLDHHQPPALTQFWNPLALVITLLVEIVTRVNGLGGLIAVSQRNYQSAEVYGLILVAGLFSFVVNGLVAVLKAWIFRHRPGRELA